MELAIDIDRPQPALRSPPRGVPGFWWRWLGERLGVKRIIEVSRFDDEGEIRWVASVVDTVSGKAIRTGSVESSGPEKEHRAVDAIDLANYLASGDKGTRVTEGLSVAEEQAKSSAEPVTVERPYYRKWWPATILGSAFGACGIAAHAVSMGYSDTGGYKSREDAAKIWLGVAIASYALGGAVIIAGIISSVTYKQEGVWVQPAAGPGFTGISITGRF
jgi:hypothetical protein